MNGLEVTLTDKDFDEIKEWASEALIPFMNKEGLSIPQMAFILQSILNEIERVTNDGTEEN